MVGFNRRFAPYAIRVRQFFANRQEAMGVMIRVNAGYLPHDHWSQSPENGGMLVGEACHFIDWARFIVGEPIQSVYACALPDSARYNRDNVSIMLRFRDGSFASVHYLSNGNNAVPKEQYEVFSEGGIARIDDFKSLELTRVGKVERFSGPRDKGHRSELESTMEAILSGHPSPIPFSEIEEVSAATLAVLDSLESGLPASLSCDRLEIDRNSAAPAKQ